MRADPNVRMAKSRPQSATTWRGTELVCAAMQQVEESKAKKASHRSTVGTAQLFYSVEEDSNPRGDRDPPNIPKTPL